MMKEYIAEATLLLMKNKDFNKITIEEITYKAGVNRSTYYRNFDSKEDIIQFYYDNILLKFQNEIGSIDNIHLKLYLKKMFEFYLKEKDNLLLIYQQGISHIMLIAFNKLFKEAILPDTPQKLLPFYYHVGGIFNTFQYWFSTEMKPSPKEMAEISVSFLPKDFRPKLKVEEL